STSAVAGSRVHGVPGTVVSSNGSRAFISRLLTNQRMLAFNHSVGTFSSAAANWSGASLMSDSSRLVVAGAFTNAGVVSFQNSIGTFNSAVVNSGTWMSDPSTNVFQNTFTVTAGGSIAMAAGDVYIFTNGPAAVAIFINHI